jgi:hypothetical protein
LVLRPGQVALEYMNGKRRQNLEPIRFYIFASSVFFLLLYFQVGSITDDTTSGNTMPASRRVHHLNQEKEIRKGTPDTAVLNQLIQSVYPPGDSSATETGTSVGDLEIDMFSSQLDSARWG